MTEIDSSEFEEEALSAISGKRIKDRVSKLSQREMRVSGSESERLTAEEIADEMRNLDLDVSIEEYETTSWEHGPATLTIGNGSETKLDVHFMPFSPPAEERGSKGMLTQLKFGFPKEYASLSDEPSIIIEDWNQDAGVHYQILSAARSGKKISALGLIGDVSKAFRIDVVPMLAKPIPFPIFSIRREDGLMLRSMCSKGKPTAKLSGKSKILPGAKSANVVGKKKGTGKEGTSVVLSAHHDGWFAGANDNLSGVASVLEAAKILSERETLRDMQFISFGSEECGSKGYQYYLWGSRQFMKRLSNDSGKIACVLNCELAGLSNAENLLVDCTPDLVSFFEVVFDDTAKRCKYPNKFEMSASVPTSSQADQLNFSLAGVPSALIYWAWFDEYHTDLDTADKLSEDKLHLFTELLLTSAIRSADQPALPLSLARYGRILRAGHTVVSSHLSMSLGRVTTPGFDLLKRLVGKSINIDEAIEALDSFSKAVGSLERALSCAEDGDYPVLNKKMLKASNVLNAALCRTGGILGEEAMFPGFMKYYEEFMKIDRAIEDLRSVKGSDMLTDVKAELIPISKPEVDTVEFDVYEESTALAFKRASLLRSLQAEVGRITEAIRQAEASVR